MLGRGIRGLATILEIEFDNGKCMGCANYI